MKRSSKRWGKKFRRRMAVCAIGGSAALSSAVCYAADAFDSASDPVYADGWQAGDNGGHGFTPWNFDSDPGPSPFHAIDDGAQSGTHYSNPFNNIGRAWDIGIAPGGTSAPRAGRGFAPLEIGQSLKVVFDNPTKEQFFKGYFVRINGGTGGTGGNICYSGPCTIGGTPKEKVSWTRFEYFSYGQWQLNDNAGTSNSGVFDTDTAAAGALFRLTRTGAETYDLLVDSVGPGADFSRSGTFRQAGAPVDWIEFTFFNTTSDTATPPTTATDFYVSSMEISGVPEPATAALWLLGAIGVAGSRRRRRSEQ